MKFKGNQPLTSFMASAWGKKSLGDGLLVQTCLLGDRTNAKINESRAKVQCVIKIKGIAISGFSSVW